LKYFQLPIEEKKYWIKVNDFTRENVNKKAIIYNTGLSKDAQGVLFMGWNL